MGFKIGDKVIHWTYGLGEIVRIEEKPINDNLTNCYVFQTSDMTIWIPIDEVQQHSLRQPTKPDEFVRLYDILGSPGEKLDEDRVMRKNQLMMQLKDGQLASICKVVRDLTYYKRIKSVIVYLMVPYYSDNRSNSRANTCAHPDFWKGRIY